MGFIHYPHVQSVWSTQYVAEAYLKTSAGGRKCVVTAWCAHGKAGAFILPSCLLILKTFVLIVRTLFIVIFWALYCNTMKFSYRYESVLFLCIVVLVCRDLTPYLKCPTR